MRDSSKFKDGLKRQTPTFQKAFNGIFAAGKLDANALEELEEALYTADFGHETVEEIIEEIKTLTRLTRKCAVRMPK